MQTDAAGETMVGETVTDYYGGSWIVSVRPDGSRMIVDLARRELTEVRPDAGAYWTLSFDRLAELRRRLLRLEAPSLFAEDPLAEKGAPEPAPEADLEIDVRELPATAAKAAGLAGRSGVRHLRVTAKGAASADAGAVGVEAAIEVWVDPSVRLAPPALAALASFERDALASPVPVAKRRETPVLDFLAAARAHAGGAVAVKLRQPLPGLPGEPAASGGTLEDVVTRLEPVDAFPRDLVAVPDGLRRRLHPYEAAIALAESDVAHGLLPGE